MKKLSIAMLSMVLAGSMLLTGCGGGNNQAAGENDSADTQQSETAENTDGGVLRMGTNATFPPYEYVDENNEVAGIDADIAAAIAEKLGMELEITDMAFDSLIPALQSDTIDIVLAGMGGELIIRLIGEAPWLKAGDKRLILQPMTSAEELRRALVGARDTERAMKSGSDPDAAFLDWVLAVVPRR